MGRLDNIIQRNKKRKFSGDRIAVGMTSLVVLVVVILLIVTLAQSGPKPPADARRAGPAPVNVRLHRTPAKPPAPPAGSARSP